MPKDHISQTDRARRARGERGHLVMGTRSGGAHFEVVELEDGSLVLRGPNGAPLPAELALTRKGAGTLGNWLCDELMPRRRQWRWSSGDICDHFGISAATFSGWVKRPEFPEPISRVKAGPIWEPWAVKSWHKNHRRPPGRPKGRRTRAGRTKP